MPRPTPAQLVYGSATVICSTLAMLLLSQARTGLWTVVIAVAALALGLLVALTAPGARSSPPVRGRRTSGAATATALTEALTDVSMKSPAGAPAAQSTPAPSTASVTAPAATPRVPEASLRS